MIASRSDLPPRDARELIKMIMVPWSYGGTEYSCREKVLEYRYMENITEIGIKEPIWSDWLEVPTENIDT